MIRRRATSARIETKLGNHSFRATGITAYLKNGGTLEKAAAMANHVSTCTTQLYDRRRDEVNLDEVERIVLQQRGDQSSRVASPTGAARN
jgi:site-specific recombinase XerD